MSDPLSPTEPSPALREQIYAYDQLLVGACASHEAARDLAALGRVLDLDIAATDSPARIWARLRPLVVVAVAPGPGPGRH